MLRSMGESEHAGWGQPPRRPTTPTGKCSYKWKLGPRGRTVSSSHTNSGALLWTRIPGCFQLLGELERCEDLCGNSVWKGKCPTPILHPISSSNKTMTMAILSDFARQEAMTMIERSRHCPSCIDHLPIRRLWAFFLLLPVRDTMSEVQPT